MFISFSYTGYQFYETNADQWKQQNKYEICQFFYQDFYMRQFYSMTTHFNRYFIYGAYICKMLHLEHSFIWCWNLDALGSRSETPGNFEMWCWRRMEKISWTDHVRNEDVLLRVKEQRNILHEIRKHKANWIGHILRRNYILQRVTEGKIQGGIEVAGRQGRRRMKLLDDLKESRGYSHLKEEALDRTMWRARFGRGFGPVVRQTTK